MAGGSLGVREEAGSNSIAPGAGASGRTPRRKPPPAPPRRRRFFQLDALGEDFDPAFSLFEPRVTEAGQLNTALVQRERLLEGQIALFELLDDRFELRDRGFEVLDRRIGHLAVPSSSQGPRRYKEKGASTQRSGPGVRRSGSLVERTSQSNSPRARVTRTRSPRGTLDASRSTRVLSAFHATA